ncbi:MAG: 50S ribosomal protein L24 [Thermoplasmatota archaeon]
MAKLKTLQPRKQRLLRFTAPHHQARKQMASHLSEELLLKYNRRSVTLIKGDEVRVMRGDFAGEQGRVAAIDASKRKVVVNGVIVKKADGTEKPLPIDPSNLKIVKLNLDDKRRVAKLEETSKSGKERFAEKRAKKTPAKKAKRGKAKETEPEAPAEPVADAALAAKESGEAKA